MTDQKILPPQKKRRRSALKRQRIALFVGLGVVALLTVAFILVWIFTSRVKFEDVDGSIYYAVKNDGQYVLEAEGGRIMPTNRDGLYITAADTLVRVDADSGACTVIAVVLTADSVETTKFNYNTYTYDVLIYPQIEMNGGSDATCIQSIEIKNKFDRENKDGTTETVEDHYTFYLNDKEEYVIKDCPGIAIDEVMFASIAVSTGYTRVVMRLDLSESNPDAAGFRANGYAEYGLPETDDAGENYFIITTKSGVSYKVLVGNRAPDGSGYYAKFAGRPDVYILNESQNTDYSAAFSKTFFAELEDYAIPNVVVPMTSTNYFDMQDFTIMELTGVVGNDWTNAAYRQIVKFSYIPIELRTGTIASSRPYVGYIGDPLADGSGSMASGYHINYYNADDCLQNMQMMQGLRVVWLDNGRDNTLDEVSFTAKYGCRFAMHFNFISERNGATHDYAPKTEVEQRIFISPKTEDDTYFVYSDFYDMVLEVEAIYLEFLEWQDVEWVEKDVLSVHIGYVEKLEFMLGNGVTVDGGKTHNVVLDFDNKASDQSETSKDGYINTDALKIYATYNNGILHQGEQISTDLYRQLHLVLLYSSLEGDATIDAATQEALRNTGDSGADLVIRMTLNEDGEKRTYTYRFYNYTSRQTYVTINGVGTSYILHKQVDKIISDLGKLLEGKNIVYNAADSVCGCRGYAA